MNNALSLRLAHIIRALPLQPGMRVLEIGCGPGAAARAIAQLIGDDGHILAIDRSAKAIRQAADTCAAEIASGRLSLRRCAVEDFLLEKEERRYHLALAVRVGVLDGRHPAHNEAALRCIAKALTADGRLFIDGGTPLREISLEKYR
jgi:cyclopropane fatty-acyl-phospholipid synthase-like methyltransferase